MDEFCTFIVNQHPEESAEYFLEEDRIAYALAAHAEEAEEFSAWLRETEAGLTEEDWAELAAWFAEVEAQQALPEPEHC